MVGDIVIQESMHTNYMTMELTCGDARNLIGTLPIVGGELITIRLHSNHLESDKDSQIIHQTFVIDSIVRQKI